MHPAIAAIAASLVEEDGVLRLDPGAVDAARAALGGADDQAVTHLLAWTHKVVRTVGAARSEPVRAAVVELLSVCLGSEAAAHDAWERSQAAELARATGADRQQARAPTSQAKPSNPLSPKPVRGLRG